MREKGGKKLEKEWKEYQPTYLMHKHKSSCKILLPDVQLLQWPLELIHELRDGIKRLLLPLLLGAAKRAPQLTYQRLNIGVKCWNLLTYHLKARKFEDLLR